MEARSVGNSPNVATTTRSSIVVEVVIEVVVVEALIVTGSAGL
jgi:hypothetical protein